jgi:hypothetical protein
MRSQTLKASPRFPSRAIEVCKLFAEVYDALNRSDYPTQEQTEVMSGLSICRGNRGRTRLFARNSQALREFPARPGEGIIKYRDGNSVISRTLEGYSVGWVQVTYFMCLGAYQFIHRRRHFDHQTLGDNLDRNEIEKGGGLIYGKACGLTWDI